MQYYTDMFCHYYLTIHLSQLNEYCFNKIDTTTQRDTVQCIDINQFPWQCSMHLYRSVSWQCSTHLYRSVSVTMLTTSVSISFRDNVQRIGINQFPWQCSTHRYQSVSVTMLTTSVSISFALHNCKHICWRNRQKSWIKNGKQF